MFEKPNMVHSVIPNPWGIQLSNKKISFPYLSSIEIVLTMMFLKTY